MPDKYTAMNAKLYEYLVAHRTGTDAVEQALMQETEMLGPVSLMQVAPEQGAFLTILTRALGVRAAVEVGTFTGYSALCIARGLPPGGKLLCCDVSEQWTAIARKHWKRAGVDGKIDLRIAPALETLRSLPREPTVDLAFIDADKTNYRNYYEEILARLRPNGVVLFDNVLWMGAVTDPGNTEESTVAIRELNDFVARDPRVESVMLSISDGLTLARKRAPGE